MAQLSETYFDVQFDLDYTTQCITVLCASEGLLSPPN